MASDYPSWAPKELCEYHKKWSANFSDPTNEALQVLGILLIDMRMKPVWKQLDGLSTEKIYEFFILISETEGPYGAGRLPLAELQREVQRIEKLSKKLADLVDKIMPMHLIKDFRDNGEITLVSSIIRELGAQSKQILNDQRTLQRPGSKFSGRTHFVRLLSAFFEETCGDPMHMVVAELHSIFLPEDKIIDTGDICSILRDSPLS